ASTIDEQLGLAATTKELPELASTTDELQPQAQNLLSEIKLQNGYYKNHK
ncbi:33289_t:CDS:1, partial [Gigaspora margarita]